MSLSECKMKSRFTISIRTIFVLIFAVCMALTWYNQWQQHQVLLNLKERLSTAESELDYQRSISVVVSGLNPYNDRDQAALQIIGRMRFYRTPNDSPSQLRQLFPDNPRKIAIGDNQTNRFVLIFCNDSRSTPGYVDTVAALIENDRLVDFKIRESNTRIEWHTTSVERSGPNGNIELVFNCRPGGFALGNPDKLIAHSIDADGFGDAVETIAETNTN